MQPPGCPALLLRARGPELSWWNHTRPRYPLAGPGASAGEDCQSWEALQPLSTPGKERVWGTLEEGAVPEPTSGRAKLEKERSKSGVQPPARNFH